MPRLDPNAHFARRDRDGNPIRETEYPKANRKIGGLFIVALTFGYLLGVAYAYFN